MANDCDHAWHQTVFRTISGRVQYGGQCGTCGRWQSVKQATVSVNDRKVAVPYDASLPDQYWKEKSSHIRAASEQRHKEQSALWWTLYRQYLASPEWSVKRDKALRRDGFICRGCLDQRASQVHHIRYPDPEKFGLEPCYWLVSLCSRCHDTVHELKESDHGY